MASPDVNEMQRAEKVVEGLLPKGVTLDVLAAEAGEAFAIRPPARVVRCDVVQAEPGVREDADERISIDLERAEFEPNAYHVVLFVNVLEHIHAPLRVLPMVRQALKDDGLFVAVLPNVTSVKAFLTRLLPWPLQRRLLTWTSKSAPAHEHVRSVHSLSLRPSALLTAAQKGGWRVEYFRLYEGPAQKSVRQRLRLVGRRWSIAALLMRLLTLGMLNPTETGIIAVFAKDITTLL